MDTSTPAVTAQTPRALSVARTVAIFAIAYAVVDLVLGIIPVNLMLRHFMAGVMTRVWLISISRLALRTLVSAIACGVTLRISKRTGGLLVSSTARGVMSIGAITAGAIAGALDVGVHRLLVWQLIHFAQKSMIASEMCSALITFVAAGAITAILIVPRTRVLRGSAPSANALQPA